MAGTPILMADGSLKPIEQVKAGDRVFSRDEATGEVAAKSVAQTFVRRASSTLALTFSTGEVIETTAEHPFYRADDGFTPAGLLAIGNSIVTRAGPSLAITDVQKGNTPATVYNFEVADFHTYFVGSSALWVHNSVYDITDQEALALGQKVIGTHMQKAMERGWFTPEDIRNYVRLISQLTEYKKPLGGGRVAFLDTQKRTITIVNRNTPPGTIIMKNSDNALWDYWDELDWE